MYAPLFKKYNKFGTCVTTDAVYLSILVTLLINRVQKDGKKIIATKMVYQAFQHVSISLPKQQKCLTYRTATLYNVFAIAISKRLTVLKYAVKSVAPQIVFRSSKAKFGRRTTIVPIEIRSYHSIKKAISWIVKAAQHDEKKTLMEKRLANSIIEGTSKKGFAFLKKKAFHARARKSSRRPKRRQNYRRPRKRKRRNFSR